MGYPSQGWGTPHLDLDGGVVGLPCPGIGLQKEYSLCGRWYTSCVHAGLFVSKNFLLLNPSKQTKFMKYQGVKNFTLVAHMHNEFYLILY